MAHSDPSRGGAEYGEAERTAFKRKTLSPVWEEQFSFKVANPYDVIVLHVYDHDAYSSDDFLGGVCVPLGELPNNNDWLEWIRLVDKKGRPAGKLHVSLRFTSRNPRRFHAHTYNIDTAIKSRPSDAVFSIDELYRNAMRLYGYLMPFRDYINWVKDLLAWRYPLVTFVYSLLWLVLCYYPRVLLLAIHFNLLRLLYWQRVKAEIRLMPDLYTASPAELKSMATLQDTHLGKFLHTAYKLMPGSYTETMRWLQVSSGRVADVLDQWDDVYTWRDPTSAVLLCIGIGTSAFLFLLIPFNYFLTVQGLWFFIRQV